MKALTSLKVIDLSWHVAGPYCTKLLADMGAEVIKVERLGQGDPSRLEGPYLNDNTNINASGLYAYLNNNKIGITLDLKTDEGINMVKELIKKADVLVENFSPGVMDNLGLSYDILKEINPSLVMTSISNYGQDGVYKDYKATELIAQAKGGLASFMGIFPREPLVAGGQLRMIEYLAGTFASVSTLTSVIGVKSTAKGVHNDISIAECSLMPRSYQSVQNSFPKSSNSAKRNVMRPSVEKCKDGYIGITVLTGQHWELFCMMTEMYDWIDDPRFANASERNNNREEYQERFDKWLMQNTREEIMKKARELRLPVIPVPTVEELLTFPQYVGRDFFVTVDHPEMGMVSQPGAPFIMSKTPWGIKKAAPLLGEDNESVIGKFD